MAHGVIGNERSSDPKRLAVGVSAFLTDLIGADLVKLPVEKIIPKFRRKIGSTATEELISSLSRGYGPIQLDQLVWACKIALAKMLAALDDEDALNAGQLAGIMECEESEVFEQIIHPSTAKLVNDALVAHCSQKIGEIYIAALRSARKGNAKSAELLLARFDPQHRGADDPTEDKNPDFSAMTESERIAWIKNMKKKLGEPQISEPPSRSPATDHGGR